MLHCFKLYQHLLTPTMHGHALPAASTSCSSSIPSNKPNTTDDCDSVSSMPDKITKSHAAPESERTAPPGKAASKASSRRGHGKSRLGCFTCKRRRVKCNESRPVCTPCTRLGLSCSYPSPEPPTVMVPSVRPRSTILHVEDLRFYHQVLTRLVPAVLLRGDYGWMGCATMSHPVCHVTKAAQ